MEIYLVPFQGAYKSIEVDQDLIMDAGVIVYDGRTFRYEHSTKFRSIPRFVETQVYVVG